MKTYAKTASVLSVLCILLFASFISGCAPVKNYDAFAKCLTMTGFAMYGSFWCPHCTNMKNKFGDSFTFIKYVECDANGPGGDPETCQKEGIEYLPTLKFNDSTKLVGEMDLEVLASKTGCALP